MTIEERLDALEKQNRRMRTALGCVAGLFVIGACLGAAQATNCLIFECETIKCQTIEANNVKVIETNTGKTCVTLGHGDTGGYMILSNPVETSPRHTNILTPRIVEIAYTNDANGVRNTASMLSGEHHCAVAANAMKGKSQTESQVGTEADPGFISLQAGPGIQ